MILKLANTVPSDDEAARSIDDCRTVMAEIRAFLPDLIGQWRAAHQYDLLTRFVEA
jgi:hypothetical protein